ncbi:MAG: (2Fe-2S)-binding protein [Gemmatimonadetes bacterium]|nr:(2Fe-2S)-binding protein [Gemmatimonadota bacterium]
MPAVVPCGAEHADARASRGPAHRGGAMRRLSRGGRVDRTRPLSFWFDGTRYAGFAGDTAASALLGAGVDVIGTSVSAGRPRGIMASGLEEPTGFAQVVETGVTEPLVRLSAMRLVDGMRLEGANRITKGYLQDGEDPARFDKRHAHVDVLVIGGGPAGLAAAATAAAAGVEVMLIDAGQEPGGALLRDGEDAVVHELRSALGAVRLLPQCTAVMLLDGNGIVALQRDVDDATRGRLWQVRARAIVHATGMLERPVVFSDNDRPGVMLASAARDYLERFALAPERGTVFTTSDDGYRTALAWHAAGVEVAAIVDPRPPGSGLLRHRAELAGLRIIDRAVVEGTDGDAQGRVTAIRVRSRDGRVRLATDLLAVCGGWEPNINLHLHLRGATRYDAWWCAAVPERPLPGQWIAGGANGRGDTASCLDEGVRAAREALGACGIVAREVVLPVVPAVVEDEPAQLWRVPSADGDESRSFVDLHRDATVAGVERAAAAGLTHIEHVKRYTLIGTGVEQGRSARVNAGVLTAALLDQPVSQIGTSGSRPPVGTGGLSCVRWPRARGDVRARPPDLATPSPRSARRHLRACRPVDAPVVLPASLRGAGRGDPSRVPGRAHRRRRRRCVDVRQDRRARAGCVLVPRPALRQWDRHHPGGQGALLHDVPDGWRCPGRRPGVAPGRPTLLRDDLHQPCSRRRGLDGGVAPDGVADPSRLGDSGHRGIRNGRHRRTEGPGGHATRGASARREPRGLPLPRRAAHGYPRGGRGHRGASELLR